MMVRNAPESIWLNVGDEDEDCNFDDLAEVTWCAEQIDTDDIEYRRVRRHSPIRAEAARYRAALEEVESFAPLEPRDSCDDFCWGYNSAVSECKAIAHRALHPEDDA